MRTRFRAKPAAWVQAPTLPGRIAITRSAYTLHIYRNPYSPYHRHIRVWVCSQLLRWRAWSAAGPYRISPAEDIDAVARRLDASAGDEAAADSAGALGGTPTRNHGGRTFSGVRPPFVVRPSLPPVVGRHLSLARDQPPQPAGAHAFGASQTGTGQHTCTGTCLHTTTGTHFVTV